MKKISPRTFWDAVKAYPDTQAVQKILSAFASQHLSSSTETKNHLFNNIIPAVQEASTINGCSSMEDIAAYYKDVIRIREQILGADLSLQMSDVPAQDRAQYWQYIANLNRSFARQKKCHPTKRFFICYCQ